MMNEIISEFTAINIDKGKRLDVFLSSKITDYSRTYIQKLIKNGNVIINTNTVTAPKFILSENDIIHVEFPPEKNSYEIKPESFSFNILFEDDDLLIIDKPAGVVVHPAAGNREGTIVNALLGKDDEFSKKFADEDSDILSAQRPGIVHRLDKDTSGCLVIAKNISSKSKLSSMFADRKITKTYFAIVYGWPNTQKGKIETLIGRHPVNRKKMAVVDKNGKEAVTLYEVIKEGFYEGIKTAFLKVNILTGRTHQIRVHMAYIKTPVIGDSVYGGNQKVKVFRQMLHAGEIKFPHPVTGETINIISQYPEDFQQILNQL